MIDEQAVRESLHRRADSIHALPADPPRAVRRARRRLALTLGVALVVVVALVIGSIVGIRSLTEVSLPRPAAPGLPMTWTHISLTGVEVDAVTPGGPGLVAVGTDSPGIPTVWTSADGLTWNPVHQEGPGDYMRDVTAGGPGLVAVGEANLAGAVWTSSDGITWTMLPPDPAVFGQARILAVARGGPGLVAVGESSSPNAVVWISSDGLTWSRLPEDPTVFGNASMRGVVRGGPGLVAVGTAGAPGSPDIPVPTAWTSRDGMTWRRVAVDPSAEAVLNDVTTGRNGLVAVGWRQDGTAAAWTSRDGLHWSAAPADPAAFGPSSLSTVQRPTLVEMADVIGGAFGYVAVGFETYCPGLSGTHRWVPECGRGASEAVVWTSHDGEAWTRARSVTAFEPIGECAAGPVGGSPCWDGSSSSWAPSAVRPHGSPNRSRAASVQIDEPEGGSNAYRKREASVGGHRRRHRADHDCWLWGRGWELLRRAGADHQVEAGERGP